jgi:cell division protein FtsQ
VGFGLLLAAGGAYAVARETSIFAVERIEVEGAPPALAAQIRSALTPLVGTNLITFTAGDADRQLVRLPEIASASYDRKFPHTLRVVVHAERAAAVLRKGPDGWLVSGTGRVLAGLPARSFPPLPRIWLPADQEITVGAPAGDSVDLLASVAAAIRDLRFPHRVTTMHAGEAGVSLALASGLEVRLGDIANLAAKLAVARAVIQRADGALYVDVSVPIRVVAGYAGGQVADATVLPESQLSG